MKYPEPGSRVRIVNYSANDPHEQAAVNGLEGTVGPLHLGALYLNVRLDEPCRFLDSDGEEHEMEFLLCFLDELEVIDV